MHFFKKIIAPVITLLVLLAAEAVIVWFMTKPDYRNEAWPVWVGAFGILLVGFEFWVIAKNTRKEIAFQQQKREREIAAKKKAAEPAQASGQPVSLERISPTRRFIEAAGNAAALPPPKAFPSPRKEEPVAAPAPSPTAPQTPRRPKERDPAPKKCPVTERANRDRHEVQRALDEAFLSFD